MDYLCMVRFQLSKSAMLYACYNTNLVFHPTEQR